MSLKPVYDGIDPVLWKQQGFYPVFQYPQQWCCCVKWLAQCDILVLHWAEVAWGVGDCLDSFFLTALCRNAGVGFFYSEFKHIVTCLFFKLITFYSTNVSLINKINIQIKAKHTPRLKIYHHETKLTAVFFGHSCFVLCLFYGKISRCW